MIVSSCSFCLSLSQYLYQVRDSRVTCRFFVCGVHSVFGCNAGLYSYSHVWVVGFTVLAGALFFCGGVRHQLQSPDRTSRICLANRLALFMHLDPYRVIDRTGTRVFFFNHNHEAIGKRRSTMDKCHSANTAQVTPDDGCWSTSPSIVVRPNQLLPSPSAVHPPPLPRRLPNQLSLYLSLSLSLSLSGCVLGDGVGEAQTRCSCTTTAR